MAMTNVISSRCRDWFLVIEDMGVAKKLPGQQMRSASWTSWVNPMPLRN